MVVIWCCGLVKVGIVMRVSVSNSVVLWWVFRFGLLGILFLISLNKCGIGYFDW